MNRLLVVAPHPDDETLGCGGTLLRLSTQGVSLGWLVVTAMTEQYEASRREAREETITRVAAAYGFEQVFSPGLPAAALDTLPRKELLSAIGGAINDFQPDALLLPHRGDVHSDHRVVFDACAAYGKWFRYPFIKRIMSYETLSETDFALPIGNNVFLPNVYYYISEHLQQKLDILDLYSDECGDFPFPRSAEAITALARLRGSQSGYQAAEAFMLLRERND